MRPSDVRALFPVLSERTYLFSGGIAPLSTRSHAAIERFAGHLARDPGDLYRHMAEEIVLVRRMFARLIGADDEEVALTDCTGTGSNLAVEMIEPRPGSNVVFDELAYPSSVYPWILPKRECVERRFVPMRDGLVHMDDMARHIDDDTLAVSLSHVSESTGFRHDLAAVAGLAHSHGALLLVDAMQSAGAVRIDVREMGVDFLSCGAMKWLLGSAGVAFFYAARQHLERMPPHAGGLSAISDPRPWGLREFRPRPGAERFQIGVPNLTGLGATAAGLEILTEVGMDQVEAHVLDLSGYCIEGLRQRGRAVLTPVEAEHRAGIVSLDMDDSREADEFLMSRGIDIHHHDRTLRIDPHIFNNRGDIDRLLTELDAYLAQV